MLVSAEKFQWSRCSHFTGEKFIVGLTCCPTNEGGLDLLKPSRKMIETPLQSTIRVIFHGVLLPKQNKLSQKKWFDLYSLNTFEMKTSFMEEWFSGWLDKTLIIFNIPRILLTFFTERRETNQSYLFAEILIFFESFLILNTSFINLFWRQITWAWVKGRLSQKQIVP